MREMSVTEQRYKGIPAVIADGRTVSEVSGDLGTFRLNPLTDLIRLSTNRRATVDVKTTHRLQEGLGQAPVADRRRAIPLIATGARLDGSTAYGAFQYRWPCCHALFLTASTTSFCRISPTSLPSDVVIGELSSW